MKVPDNVEEMKIYFEKVISLLGDWKWIYEDRATDILLKDTLNSEYLDILEELDYEELNQLPNGFIKEGWPEELKNFIKDCAELSLMFESYQSEENPQLQLPARLKKHLSAKKEHEIYRLTDYVLKHCNDNNIKRVYDIGSGLGYIDRLLLSFSDLSVVGIEADRSKIDTALKLNKDLLEKDKSGCISYLEGRLEDYTIEKLVKRIEQYDDVGCFIGLHACADLSVDSLRLFLLLDKVKSLVLMPCCYHKLKNSSNFPASSLLCGKLMQNKMELINTTFLRLACESTKERWRNQSEEAHKEHGFLVLARAVIQLYLVNKKYKAKRAGRRCVTRQHNGQWPDYVAIWLDRHDITNELKEVMCKDTIQTELLDYWTLYQHLVKRVECYTSLQVCLQSVAESLLIADKLCFLLQYGLESVTAVRITDPTISPRSLAIVACKYNVNA